MIVEKICNTSVLLTFMSLQWTKKSADMLQYKSLDQSTIFMKPLTQRVLK